MSHFVIAIIYEILTITPTLEIFNTKILFLNKILYTTHFISSARGAGARAPPKKSFQPRNLNIMKFVLNISKRTDAEPHHLAEMRGYRNDA